MPRCSAEGKHDRFVGNQRLTLAHGLPGDGRLSSALDYAPGAEGEDPEVKITR